MCCLSPTPWRHFYIDWVDAPLGADSRDLQFTNPEFPPAAPASEDDEVLNYARYLAAERELAWVRYKSSGDGNVVKHLPPIGSL